jgi:hypothetical protein
MKSPIIKLQFDKELDQDIAWQFYKNPNIGGVDFWQERVVKFHPKLKDVKSREYLNEYILNYYNKHQKELEKLSKEINLNLKQKQEEFFKSTDKVFNDYPWPSKEIIGNFSIFNFCPRFLEDNEFQVFLYDDKNHQLFTIFHECLHFIFYDYAKKYFPETLSKMDTESGIFWNMAEVFNVVIQDTDDFKSLHGEIKDIKYPEYEDLIKCGINIFNKDKNVHNWIKEMLKNIK